MRYEEVPCLFGKIELLNDRRVKVSADGKGVVSHAGSALLRELATETGLAGGVTGALLDTYRGFPVHLPGQVFADLAVAIADGADASVSALRR